MTRPASARAAGFVGIALVATIGLGLGLVVGCSGGPLSQPLARDQLAVELCAQAVRCGQVGAAPRPYASADGCVTVERVALQERWPPDRCAEVDTTALDSCLEGVRAASCDGGPALADWLSAHCLAAQICGPDPSLPTGAGGGRVSAPPQRFEQYPYRLNQLRTLSLP